MNKLAKNATIGLLSVLSLVSCSKKDDDKGTENPEGSSAFTIYGATASPISEYMLNVSDLGSGTITSIGNGIEMTGKLNNSMWTIRKGNTFYALNRQTKVFSKLVLENNTFKMVKEIPFTQLAYLCWNQWVDENTLLIGGGSPDGLTIAYTVINTETLTITKSGTLPVAAPAAGLKVTPCSGILKDGKLYLGYTYTDDNYTNEVYAIDKAYLAVMDYPSLANVTLSEDTRSTFPGSGRVGLEAQFVYNNDIYILTSPVAWNGDNKHKPTGFYKIKNGETTFDSAYFFDLSAKLNNNDPDGMMYLGNGKAIVRNYKDEFVTTWDDWGKPIVEYWYLDVVAQTTTKINVPLFYGGATTYGYADGKVYLPVRTDADGLNIYVYDPATNTVTKGAKVNGLHDIQAIYNY